jgi:hypothetical protein
VEASVNNASIFTADKWNPDGSVLIPAPYCAGFTPDGCQAHMAERRIDERRRVLMAGKIVWDKGSSVLDCIVRNVSKGGAMMEVWGALTVTR